VFDGFVAIDSSVYAECSNYVETGRYSCPDGFYFDEGLEQCVDKNSSATGSTSAPFITTAITNLGTDSSETPLAIDTMASTTCENIPDGKVALPSLQGWVRLVLNYLLPLHFLTFFFSHTREKLVCNNGEVLVTEYCGASKLYNIDYEVCVNYCEGGSNSDTFATQVVLPKLGGQVTCDDALGEIVENIVCSPGTYFDVSSDYCRNFCENQTQQYVSFSEQQGGVTCQNGSVVAVEWCASGAIFSAMIGVCMQTDSPSLSPNAASPTTSLSTAAPTISIFSPPPTSNPTLSMQPSLNVELVVDVPDTSEKDKKPKQELIATEDNGAGTLTNLVIRVTLWISGLQVILFL
jgi:hypothetical protein